MGNEILIRALAPLAAIADAYDRSELDEHRPEWGVCKAENIELHQGRGGKRLLTLQDAFNAREALRAFGRDANG